MRNEKGGYVVVRLNDHYPMYFESCSIYWDDKEYKMNGFEHMGNPTTMVVSTDLLEIVGVPEFDLRYSINEGVLDVYMSISELKDVYFENHGDKCLKLKFGCELFELEPGPFSYLMNKNIL